MRDWRAEVATHLGMLALDATQHRDVVEELAQDLETRYQALLERGTNEAEAYREVLDELTASDLLHAELRRARHAADHGSSTFDRGTRGSWLETLWQDVRYAVRTLGTHPGFAAVAVITLALGIGASTAIFTVVNGVMLRPLPYAAADALVGIAESNPERGMPTFHVSHPNFLDWRAQNHGFERLAATSKPFDTIVRSTQSHSFEVPAATARDSSTATSGGEADVARAIRVTADYLPVLGVTPALGRNFRPNEDRPGGNTNVVLLAHGFWQRRFGDDAGALGRTLMVDDEAYTIVGVLPESFRDIGVMATREAGVDLLLPLAPDPARSRGDHKLRVLGRLNGGVSMEQARSEMEAIAARLAQQYPDSNEGWGVRMGSFYEWAVPKETRVSLLVLAGAVGLLVLIACSNVASVMLARGAERHREMAIRAALGARRSRVVRQLLIEALGLALVAGGLGGLLALLATRLVIASGPETLPRLDELSVDARVLGFAFLMSLVTGVLFGLMPAMQTSRVNLNETLNGGGRSVEGGASRQRLRNVLVIAEVALSVVLLVAAGLLIRSFWRLQQVDPGFQVDGLLTLGVHLPETAYRTDAEMRSFYERLLGRVRRLPGVQGAAISSGQPLHGVGWSTEIQLPGAETMPAGAQPSAERRIVSPEYFATLGIPLRGRDFDARDRESGRSVVIISEAMARAFWPDEDPLGKAVGTSFSPAPFTIIGIAGDVRSFGLDEEARPTVYSVADPGWETMKLVLRSHIDPASQVSAVRDAARSINPGVAVYGIEPFDQLLSQSVSSQRFNMHVVGGFAAVALLLASVGLFGVMAYLVAQRTRDIGIRMALGASRRDIFRMIAGQGLALAIVGALIGIAGARAAAGMLESLLFSVTPTDAMIFTVVPILLVIVAFVACYVPARRAMRVDPLVALRSE